VCHNASIQASYPEIVFAPLCQTSQKKRAMGDVLTIVDQAKVGGA